jgi:hypothetical protein
LMQKKNFLLPLCLLTWLSTLALSEPANVMPSTLHHGYDYRGSFKQKKAIDKLSAKSEIEKQTGQQKSYYFPVTSTRFYSKKDYDKSGRLLANFPSMNEDVYFLERRSRHEQALKKNKNHDFLMHSIELSGAFAARIAMLDGASNAMRQDIDLSKVQLDFFSDVNPWVMVLASFNYDKSDMPMLFQSKPKNARAYLKRGFITIGNMDQSPYYTSIGQMYLPFGSFSSSRLSGNAVLGLGRITGRVLVSGYHDLHQTHAFFLMQGSSQHANQQSIELLGFNNIFHVAIEDDSRIDVAVGYVSNMVESDGLLEAVHIQHASHVIDHPVPAIDANVTWKYRDAVFKMEYLMAGRHFSASDFAYQGKGAKPKAIYLEVGKDANIDYWDSSVSLSVSYDQSWEASSMQVSKRSMAFFAGTTLWKNTSQSLELRHSWAYPGSAYRGGNQVMSQIQASF